MRNLATMFVGYLIAFSSLSCLADTSDLSSETQAANDAHDQVSDLSLWAAGRLEPFHTSLTEWVETNSRSIDSFFGSTDALTVKNDSYLRIKYETELFEGRTSDNELGASFRLDLPTTEKRLRLIIENESVENRGTLVNQEMSLSNNNDKRLNGFLIGIKRLSSRDKQRYWNVQLGAGVKLGLRPDPYVRATTQRLWDFSSNPWQLHSDNRISWFNEEGYLARTRWDLGRPFNGDWHFRLLSNVQWREEVDTLEYSQTVEFNHRLNRRSVVRYSGVVLGESASNPAIEDSYVEWRYRRDIHKGFTFFDIAPSLHFPREEGREPRWALNLSLEVYFRHRIEQANF